MYTTGVWYSLIINTFLNIAERENEENFSQNKPESPDDKTLAMFDGKSFKILE